MAGKGGGAWKVAYADFVTAMMAFFLVMWLVGQSPKVKEAIADHFNEPFQPFEAMEMFEGGAPRRRENPSKSPRNKSHKPSLSDRPEDPETRRPRMLVIRQGDRSGVGTVIFFAEDSAELDQAAKTRLDQLAPQLEGKPHKVEIRGHSSRRLLSGEEPAEVIWQQSYARCLAAMKYLAKKGVAESRMRLSQAGGNEPLTIGVDDQGRSHNPRVEVLMLNEWVEDLVGTAKERAERTSAGDGSDHKKSGEHPPAEHSPAEHPPGDHAAEGHPPKTVSPPSAAPKKPAASPTPQPAAKHPEHPDTAKQVEHH